LKDLTIRLKLDRTQARAATEAQIADHKRIAESADDVARRERKSNQQSLTDAQVSARAKQKLIQEGNAARIKAAVDAEHAEKKSNETTLSGLVAIGSQTLVAVGAASQLLSVMRQVAEVTEEAARRQRELQKDFVNQRDELAELAAIQGKVADNKFVEAHAQFNVDTRMKPRESIEFRKEFAGSGAQFVGKNIDQAEYDELEKQAAQMATARGMEPGVAGDFFGKVLGLKDFSKFGNQASEQALATGNSAIEIMKRGSGNNNTLASQYSMVASSMLNEDSMKGLIQDPNELATLISTAAEKSPAGAAETVKGAARGMRDFDGDAKPLLDAAGVNASTGLIDGIKKIAPILEKEAKESGVKIDDIINKYFHANLSAEAIGILVNKGVSGGIFKDREDLVAGRIAGQPRIDGPGPAMDTIKQFQDSERGMVRQVDAQAEQQKTEKGAAGSGAELLRRQAEKRLTDRGELGTTQSDQDDFWFKVTRLGLIDPKDKKLDDETVKMLQERGKPKNVPVSDMLLWQDDSVEGKNKAIQGKIKEIEAAGGNPFVEAMNANTKVMEEQNRMMAKAAPPAVPPQLRGPPGVVTRQP
jgi:hypothetical protein